ncbi:MAG: methylated-DNA--[protein]-cysteine S-methyltransferase [Gammaproteobacteria bacterium]
MNMLTHDSPVGPLTLVSEEGKLVGCFFANHDLARKKQAAKGPRDAVLDQARKELDGFFAGRLKKFTLTLAPRGTEFQRRVWKALQAIPYGRTASYGGIAKQIGVPAAMRAVGAANGQNPICIIIPCHRVIGANGSLRGFGGGLDRKRFLLGLERGKTPLL